MRQLLFLYVSFSAEVNIKTKFKTLLIKCQQFTNNLPTIYQQFTNNLFCIPLMQSYFCLKKLTEKRIDSKANPSDAEKNWWNTFLEIWKKYMKKHLEQEHLLVD